MPTFVIDSGELFLFIHTQLVIIEVTCLCERRLQDAYSGKMLKYGPSVKPRRRTKETDGLASAFLWKLVAEAICNC